jgi:hypothetical protein
MSALCVYGSWKVLTAPNTLYPGGIDGMGHLLKVKVVADRWERLEFTDWFPYWYNGSTTIQYYPPLAVWVPAAVQLLAGNVFLTFKILAMTCTVGGGAAAAAAATKAGVSRVGSIVAGALYAAGPYTLFTVYSDNTLGRILSLPLYPLLLGALLDLDRQPCGRHWAKSVVFALLLVLGHAMHAYILAICLGVVLVALGVAAPRAGRSLVLMASVAVESLLLAAFWAVPGATQWETPGVPWAPPERVAASSLDTAILGDLAHRFGPVFLAAAVTACLLLPIDRVKRRLHLSFAAGFALTASLCAGPSNPVYRLVPLNASLSPLKFINAAYLPAAILVGIALDRCCDSLRGPGGRRIAAALPVAVLAAFLLVDVAAARRDLPGPYAAADIQPLVSLVPVAPGGPFQNGRIATELPRSDSHQAYFPVERGLNMAGGWNLEGTPHTRTFHKHNIAYPEGFPEYVLRNWNLWNCRSALFEWEYDSLRLVLEEAGWRRVAGTPRHALYVNDAPQSYLMILGTDAIAIGRSSFYVSRLLPWVTEGRNPDPLSYPWEYLSMFKTVFLYDIPDVGAPRLEAFVRRLLGAGKRVVIDLSASGIPRMFGVLKSDVEVPPDLVLEPSAGSPYSDRFTLKMTKGAGAAYDGLDEAWMSAWVNGTNVQVSGVRRLPEGEVYFTGLHVPRLAAPSFKEAARAILEPLLAPGESAARGGPRAFRPSRIEWRPDGLEFSYESAVAVPLLVSVTYTPRWKCLVDERPASLYNHEDLVAMILPAGQHSARLRYGRSEATVAGWALTATGLAAAPVCWLCVRRGSRRRLSRLPGGS